MSLFNDTYGVKIKYEEIGHCYYAIIDGCIKYVTHTSGWINEDMLKETFVNEDLGEKLLNIFKPVYKKFIKIVHTKSNLGEIWSARFGDTKLIEFYLKYYEQPV